jgi:predicted ATPase/tetratricopeptide (TPR) repeat protein
VRGEHEVQVLPLGLPEQEAVARADRVARSAAVDLFLQRVRAVRPEYVLTDADAPCVAALCARLDGVPLALELAAAQLKYMDAPALLDHLRTRMASLEGRARDLPPRHRSLHATIAWSYDLLTAPEQRLFRRLAAFVGGFSEEAARAVCGEAGGPPDEPARTLAALVDKSVVQVRPADGAGLRFTMLETIHEFARERLIDSGEEELLANRHAAYFCRLAESFAPHPSAVREAWLWRLDREAANLWAAVAWTATRGDPCTGLSLAGALGWFWILRSYIGEGTHWMDLLFARPLESCAAEARAGALHTAAALAWKRDDYALARRYAEESVALRRGLHDRRRLAFSLAIAGLVATSLGDLTRAIEHHEECLGLYRDEADRWGIGYALSNLGDARFARGDLAEAERCYAEGLAQFTWADDPWGRGIVLHTLGNVAWARGDLATARARYEASVAVLRTIGNRENVARGLTGLAAVALRADRSDEARRQLTEALLIWRDIGSRSGVASCLAGLAAVHAWHRRFQAAARLFGAAEGHGRGHPAPYLVDADIFSHYHEATRAHLGDASFAQVWAEGQALTLEQAIEEALAERAAASGVKAE